MSITKEFVICLFIEIAFFIIAEEEFDELCFKFGIELDEVVSKLTLYVFSVKHLIKLFIIG